MNIALNEFLARPYAQVVAFLIITFIVVIVFRPRDANAFYTIAGVTYALFIVTNSVLVYFAASTWSYFFLSLLFSVVYLLAFSALSSLYIRLANVNGSGESGMIFLIIIYHPLALLLVIFAK